MKKIFNIIPCMAVVTALVSCNSVMDDKDDIDALYAVGTAPTVTITSATGASSAITVAGTVSDASKAVEVGMLVSTSEDMADAAYWPANGVTAEFTAVAKKLQPLSTYYVQTYSVAKDNQRTYSEVQKVQTSIPEFGIAQLNGNVYVGSTVSYWDNSYNYSVSVMIDTEDSTKCIIYDLEPYFAANGYVSAKGHNTYEGTINWKNKVITVENGQAVGYNSVILLGMNNPDPDVSDGYDDIYLDIEDYGETLVIRNAYGSYDNGWYDLYSGGIRLVKQ